MGNYIFGPVPSRRLGRSLGVDLVPFKTCSYDCIYCQLGRTTCKTVERKEWVPLDDVILGLEDGLSTCPDYVTLSGSGEPTLHSQIGELIDRIKSITNVRVAVLTNGSLLWREEVRRELREADLVIPSLDAGNESTFRRVNRPHEDSSFEKLMHGLVTFRSEFRGECWLELFLIADITATDVEAGRLVECVDRIGPDRVQLNTATRPPAESFAVAVPQQRMLELAQKFRPPAEVIAEFRHTYEGTTYAATRDDILNLLRRRPCTLDDIADGLGMHRNEVVKYVEELTAQELLLQTQAKGRLHYQATQ